MKKIVFIEDDEIVSSIYSNKLRTEGYEVETALDGASGLKLIEDTKPALVILDLMLPKLNGVEILKSVRARPEFKQLPIVVFSNSYLARMVQDAWKAGATKCLSKIDSTPKQIVEIINRLIAETSPPAQPAQPAASTVQQPHFSSDADAAFQADLTRTFLDTVQSTRAELRNLFVNFSRTRVDTERTTALFNLYRKVHSVTGNLSIAGKRDASVMGAALEALIKELYEKPAEINLSNVRTAAQALDFWTTLFDAPVSGAVTESLTSNIVVVDDELLSRKAVLYALQKAGLQAISIENPDLALNLLAENNFDLVFLDIDMPGMTGYELCTRLRAMPHHKETPVIFVTGINDFDARAKSSLAGGSDLIGKPFLFIELTVKALTHFLKFKLTAKPGEPARPSPASPEIVITPAEASGDEPLPKTDQVFVASVA